MSDQEFNTWNEIKKKIDTISANPKYYPHPGEVWMSSLGKNIGHEQNGSGIHFSRPLLVVKKFNNHMFWCIPLSTKQKPFDFYFNFTDPNGKRVSAILAQLKLTSIKRLKRKLYAIDPALLNRMKEKLINFLE